MRRIATLWGISRLLWWVSNRLLNWVPARLLWRVAARLLRLRWISPGLRLRRIAATGPLRLVAALLTPLSGILRHGRPSSSS